MKIVHITLPRLDDIQIIQNWLDEHPDITVHGLEVSGLEVYIIYSE